MNDMQLVKKHFLDDTRNHEMQIIRDDGVNRHIRFSATNTSIGHFDLITWPGHLCYTGDMGSFLFKRANDMFSFFRGDSEELSINPQYWSEKLEAVSRHGGYEEFDEDEFKRVISDDRLRWIRDYGLDKNSRRELWDAVTKDVLDRAEDGEYAALNAAHNFRAKVGGRNFQFDNFYEHRTEKYTHTFLWCCYALVWGIGCYDEEVAKAIK